MDRRGFIKSGIGSMATLGLGETILLTPNAASAMNYRPVAEGGRRKVKNDYRSCLLYTSPSPRDRTRSRMPSSA